MIALLSDVWFTFRADRMRFLLTLSGVVIGVASLVMLSGLLEGGKEALVSASQQATEDNLVKVKPTQVPEKQRMRTSRPLELADREALGESPLLGGAPVELEQEIRAEIHYEKARGWGRIVGATPGTRELYSLELERGRFLSALDVRAGARVAVVGSKVYSDVLGSPAALGQAYVVVRGERFTVVGVLRHKASLGGGEGGWMWDRRVLVPQTAFAAAYRGDRRIDHLFVRLAFAPGLEDRVKEARGIVRGTLLRRHYGVKNFEIEGEGEEDAKFDLILGIIRTLLLATAILALVVGGINIMNIMLVSVTERTREIGIRRALGAARTTVLTHFLAESVLVASLGGLVGAVLGLLVSRGAAAALSLWLGQWRFHLVGWSIGVGIGAAAFVGVLFGIYPAWRASRLDPAEALRFE